MNIERKHTAILVFSLSAHEEKGRKNMFGRHQNFTNKRTFELLIHLTKKTVKNSKVDVIWIGEKEQKGNSFGERFTNAFLQLFDQGYEKVIAIGNDCPDLTTAHIETAITQLDHQSLVLGPTLDGGDYLIGIHQRNFDSTLFGTIPWESQKVHVGLITMADGLGLQVSCLQTLMDIDNFQSIKTYIQSKPSSIFAFGMGQILCWFVDIHQDSTSKIKSIFLSSFQFLRPPPALPIR